MEILFLICAHVTKSIKVHCVLNIIKVSEQIFNFRHCGGMLMGVDRMKGRPITRDYILRRIHGMVMRCFALRQSSMLSKNGQIDENVVFKGEKYRKFLTFCVCVCVENQQLPSIKR